MDEDLRKDRYEKRQVKTREPDRSHLSVSAPRSPHPWARTTSTTVTSPMGRQAPRSPRPWARTTSTTVTSPMGEDDKHHGHPAHGRGRPAPRMDSAAPPGLHVSPTREKGETEARDEGSTVGKSDTFAEVLPQGINFSKNVKEFVVGFHFPWLPSRCKHCDKWGHTEEVCAAKRKDSGKEIERNEEITQQQELNKVLETEGSMVTTKQLMINNGEEMPLLQLRNKVVGSAEAECVEEATLQLELVEQRAEKVVNTVTEEANNWHNVSPAKAGRSPVVTPQKTRCAYNGFEVCCS
ncbi:hypothetical protein DY000_02050223 [Brassica cretica]|uniref:DUF4283 domain-containing protein n=1 Tax=Brassica cretica TaxID=69181 RepID=A0ABQ7EX93_BRACR|nr:hypothetical protein DY000_02050223 [Brassica cretica]